MSQRKVLNSISPCNWEILTFPLNKSDKFMANSHFLDALALLGRPRKKVERLKRRVWPKKIPYSWVIRLLCCWRCPLWQKNWGKCSLYSKNLSETFLKSTNILSIHPYIGSSVWQHHFWHIFRLVLANLKHFLIFWPPSSFRTTKK